jgi:predicted small secreted protein
MRRIAQFTASQSTLNQRKGNKMKRLTKTVMFVFLLAAGLVAFSGCRTAHGFGEDMEKAGESIQDGTK